MTCWFGRIVLKRNYGRFIMKKGWFFLLVAGACMSLFFTAGNASANLILNGSFEQGDRSSANSSWKTVNAGDVSITNWTVGNTGVDWHNNAELKNPQNGNFLVDLNLSGPTSVTLSQSFATEIGATYKLTFFLAAPNQNDSVNVSIKTIKDTLFSQGSSPNDNLVWGEKTLDFTATATSTTLTFSNTEKTGYYWGPLLDNVSVEKTFTPISTPIPAAAWLFSSGFLGLAGIRRKIRK